MLFRCCHSALNGRRATFDLDIQSPLNRLLVRSSRIRVLHIYYQVLLECYGECPNGRGHRFHWRNVQCGRLSFHSLRFAWCCFPLDLCCGNYRGHCLTLCSDCPSIRLRCQMCRLRFSPSILLRRVNRRKVCLRQQRPQFLLFHVLTIQSSQSTNQDMRNGAGHKVYSSSMSETRRMYGEGWTTEDPRVGRT